MKNKKSVQKPTIKRWSRRKLIISMEKFFAFGLFYESSPVTPQESKAETILNAVTWLPGICKGASVKKVSVKVANRWPLQS